MKLPYDALEKKVDDLRQKINAKKERMAFFEDVLENSIDMYWQTDLERIIRNARMYWHVNFGQWPQFVVDQLRDEGRRPPTFPVIPDKLETLVGSFLANGSIL